MDLDALSPEKRALVARILKEQGERYNHFPASFAQARLWFIEQLNPGQATYNIPCALYLEGPLDIASLEWAFARIVERHDALRTSFTAIDGVPLQVVHPRAELHLEIEDRPTPVDRHDEVVVEAGTREGQRRFDLKKAPLIRAKVLRLSDNASALLVVLHHIIADGWSVSLLFRELAELYAAHRSGRAPNLPALSIQYKDFAVWQRRTLQGERLDAQLAYWRQRLSGIPEIAELPSDRPRRPRQQFAGRRKVTYLEPALATAVRALCKAEESTLFVVGLAAFNVLLTRYTGQPEAVVGTTMANRTRVEVEPLIGFFVNMAVLRTDCGDNPSFRDLLARVRTEALGIHAHQDLPFDILVNHLQPSRDLSRQPVFQVVFAVQNIPFGDMALAGLAARGVELDNGTAKWDLFVSLMDFGGRIRTTWEYDSDLFDDATIDRFAASYARILQGVCADPTQPILALPMASADERETVVDAWNRTAIDVPIHSVIAEVEAWAAAQPETLALVSADQRLTYRELDEGAR
ncbi:MAG: non-ribosomal peptide synthetase, partial [Myxococcales bacterium]|nr:non-ribosomal peptide synthetase [Myxococcales bacterium]